MPGIQYYCLDTETTGLKTFYHELNQVSIIRCSDRVQLSRDIRCLYPERANFDALTIQNKTPADLERGRDKEIVVAECEKFLNEDGCSPDFRCIIAHNAAFDRRFLHALWEQCGKEFPAHLWLCTMALTKEFAKQMGIVKPKVKLHNALDLLGIKKISDAHNARSDSRNGYLLYKGLVEDKKIDYLPFIKRAVHQINADDEPDMSLLEDI